MHLASDSYKLQQSMQEHFKFGHTMKPQQRRESSQSGDDLGQLFKIGNQRIQIELQQVRGGGDSDDTPQIHKTAKQKKVKKEKKAKKKKRSSPSTEWKGSFKRPTKNEQQEQHPEKYKGQIRTTQLSLFLQGNLIQSKPTYNPSVQLRSLQQKLQSNSTIQFKLRLGDDLLNIDVMDFPQKELYRYGLMQKNVPQYSRFPQTQIIGLETNHQKKIIKKLNKMIHQNSQNPNKDQIAKQRYFNFSGFQRIQAQKPPSVRSQPSLPSFIPLSTETFSQSKEEETLMKMNREFNSKLKQDPQNISLWLQFCSVQRKQMSVAGNSSKTRQAILQRQLSILQKALELNPGQQKLACSLIDTMLSKQTDASLIIQKCVQFIKSKPHCVELWRIYLKLKLGEFSFYSHQMARKVCEQVLKMVKGMIDGARSAVVLWKLRKVSLEIIKIICRLYRLQGYGELATAIIIALLQFNWFLPEGISKITNYEQKVKAFGHYWQDHNRFKLGEVLIPKDLTEDTTTLQSGNLQALKFIGSSQSDLDIRHLNLYQKELALHETIWRPSHPILDGELINQRPDSYILIQDIDFTLANYRDNDSLMAFVDLLAEHLQLPPVFTVPTLNSEFSLLLIQKAYNANQANLNKTDLFEQSGYFWWSRFWNPLNTLQLFGAARVAKLQYFRRILMQIKGKTEVFRKQINVYLMFLNCCYYLNPQIREILGLEQTFVLKLIEELLGEQPLTAIIWSIYIHSTFLATKNINQCLQCWMQLLQSNKIMHNGTADSHLNQTILLWFWQFVKIHVPQYKPQTLKVYLILLDQAQLSKELIGLELTQNDRFRLERYLVEKASLLSQNNQILNQKIIQDAHLLSFMLDILKLYDFSHLKPFKDQMIDILMEKAKTQTSCSEVQYFIVHSLIFKQELKVQLIKETLHSYLLEYLQTLRYWVQSDSSFLITFTVQFQLFQPRSLSLWMALGVFLWQKYERSFSFHQFFYKIAKKVTQDQTNKDNLYLILLNKLLIHDTREIHSHFALESSKKCPYSKQLYLINLMISQSSPQSQKIKTIMNQKGIRVLDTQTFQ